MSEDYYTVLGVPRDASPEEIRSAYRRLARATHPDSSGDHTAEQFHKVQEAWEILSDPARRRAYDEQLHRRRRPAPADAPPRHSGPGVMHFSLQISPAEAATGGELPLRVPAAVPCQPCGGRGVAFPSVCPFCRGAGRQVRWAITLLRVPPGLRHGQTVELSLDYLGLPGARLVLHVEVLPG